MVFTEIFLEQNLVPMMKSNGQREAFFLTYV